MIQQTASQVIRPSKPSKGASSQPDHTVSSVASRILELTIAKNKLTIAKNEVKRCYTSLFWGRIYAMTRTTNEFKENLQHVGSVVRPAKMGGIKYKKSLDFTSEKHAGKGVYLLSLGEVADLGEIWIVIIGDPINNHFVTNCQAEDDFNRDDLNRILPKDFKGFKKYQARDVAAALTFAGERFVHHYDGVQSIEALSCWVPLTQQRECESCKE